MQRIALVVLVLSIAALVFVFAAFSALRAENPWIKALPALLPFAALVATVFFAVGEDAWVPTLVRRAIKDLIANPGWLYTVAGVAAVSALALGWHVGQLSRAREGLYAVQVVKENDVPEEQLPGIPVTLEHKLRREVVERLTDSEGKAEFSVDLADVFAVRVRCTADPEAPVVVLASDARVNDKTKTQYLLVRRNTIPDVAWLGSATASPPGEARDTFAQIPAAYFRWQRSVDSAHTIDADGEPGLFPFTLPGAEVVIRRREFTLGFSPRLRLPRWVAYRIMPGPIQPRRLDNFPTDPAIPANYQASVADYATNPYDRGHLVRRADLFGWGEAAWRKAFYLSAVVPQLGYVNQKSWLALEEYTSRLARDGQADGRIVYVIRGPAFAETGADGMVNTTMIGEGLLPVPTHFFQILVVRTPDGVLRTECHLVPNAYVPLDQKGVERFLVPVARIAQQTGLTIDAQLLR